ncbi:MAG: hypothetical protein ACM3WV_04415 [Bacillota bacterium]
MKSLKALVLFCLALVILSGCGGGPPLTINEGSYALKHASSWDNIYRSGQSDYKYGFYYDWITDSELEFKINKPEKIDKYGKLTFGADKQEFNFAIAKNDNSYIADVYFDRNNDGCITKGEAHKAKILGREEGKGLTFYNSSLDDLPLYVKYAKSDGTTVSKIIYVLLEFSYLKLKSGYNYSSDFSPYWLIYKVKSCFSGDASINLPEGPKRIKYVLLDGNQNCLFNDYGVDWIIIDKDFDNKFDLAGEMQHLVELFDIKDPGDPKKIKTMRLTVFGYPTQLIVSPADAPAPIPDQYETAESDTWKADPVETPAPSAGTPTATPAATPAAGSA